MLHTVFIEILHDCRKALLGLLVEVGDGNAGGQNCIIRVLGGEVRGGLGSEILQEG